MLSLFLQAAQQAKQVAPNVYVTVQQPPGGMPEWVRIVISASVGAFFGVGGNVAMELLKPKIVKGPSRREVVAQLVIEIRRNLDHLESIKKVIQEAASEKKGCSSCTLLPESHLERQISSLQKRATDSRLRD
jgi:hypothetical protein